MDHPHVPHPRALLAAQPGLTHRDLLPAGTRWLTRANTRLAFAVAAAYGAAVTIWLFAAYTLLGAAEPHLLTILLFWSNGIQLVFCAVMTFVGNVTQRQLQAKADADHTALTHIAQAVDELAGRQP